MWSGRVRFIAPPPLDLNPDLVISKMLKNVVEASEGKLLPKKNSSGFKELLGGMFLFENLSSP